MGHLLRDVVSALGPCLHHLENNWASVYQKTEFSIHFIKLNVTTVRGYQGKLAHL